MPNYHVIAVLLIMSVTFYLYTRPWVRIEVVSLGMMSALVLLFHIFPFVGKQATLSDTQIISAFGHPALLAICSLMVLGQGLTMTGALEPLVRLLARLWKITPTFGLLVTLLFAAFASAFVNDTPVLVLMLPLLLGIARKTGSPASKSLMPVNFAILCGGMLTSIGTSTNILVLSIAAGLGYPSVGIFDFTEIAATALLVAIPYLWLVAPRLLPATSTVGTQAARQYYARIVVEAGGKLLNMTPTSLENSVGKPQLISAVERDGVEIEKDRDAKFEVGEAVLVLDTPHGLRELASAVASPLINRDNLEKFIADTKSKVDQELAEVVIAAHSKLVGRTVKESRFADQFGVVVVGISRSSDFFKRQRADASNLPLDVSDVLLIQGRTDRIQALKQHSDVMLLDSSLVIPRTPKAPIALAIMAAVILAAATKIVPIHVAAMVGMLLMVLTGCVLIEGIGRALSLEVVLLVASSIALGQALVSTGGADWIAAGLVQVIKSWPAAFQVAAFISFAALLTNFVSNSAAAAIGTPIAMAMANLLGSPPQPFVLAILFGANLSFATPMAYQTNLLIMHAAGYTFRDFVKVGTPLVLLMVVTLSYLLASHYGL